MPHGDESGIRVPLDFGDYRRWLYKTAADLLPGGYYDTGIDDLAQEGRVAMWRALETHDPARGALAPWVTRAARTRMRDLAWGHGQPTGHEPVRGFTEAEVAVYIDGQESPDDLAPAEAAVEMAEPALMEVLRELPEEQREYIWLRFWCGIEVSSRVPGIRSVAAQYPILRKRWVWVKARETLAADPRVRQLAEVTG